MDADLLTDWDLPNHSLTDQDALNQEAAGQNLSEYLEEYSAPRRGDICTGVVLATTERGLIVDVSLKREGLVPHEDLLRLEEETRSEIQVGSTVTVFVLRPEDREGRPILSIHQAYLQQDWIDAEKMMESGELYEGEISGHNRGGIIVKFGKIRGFLPASQIVGLPRRLSQDDRRQRLADMVGQQVGLKIIEVDRRRRRLIFSQRQAQRAWQEHQRQRVMSQLVEGETRHGKVTSITSFGAFVDLGGADGLIHVSELSWGRVDNPRQVLKIGDEVDVYVLSVDWERKRIALSLRKLQPDPWTLVDDHYQIGQLVEGQVTRVLDFGAFVELDIGMEGLLHASEMIGTPELAPSDVVHLGETLLVKIIRIDSQKRRLALSARQVRQGEWERWVAEQQAARKAQEAAVAEEADEEAIVPEAEAAVAEEADEEAIVPEAEAAVAEEAGEEAIAPEAEAAVAEEADEEAIAPEAETAITEEADEETIAPEAEAAVTEEADEEAIAPEAEAEVTEEAGEEATVLEAEGAVAEETDEEAIVPEAEGAVAEEASEEAIAPEAEAEVAEEADEEAIAPEAEAVVTEGAVVPEAE